MRRRALLALLLCASSALLARGIGAQVAPDARWRTIRTTHFRVHFTPDGEEPARRAAAAAETAYAQLSRTLVPPHGMVDLVVADDQDLSNGFATPFPTNRAYIYLRPPLDQPSLRFYNDWVTLVVTHELTHIFQLDRAGGWWRVAQRILGRNPLVMPNLYDPAWVTEGIATYYESALTGAGRVRGTHERMIVRAAAAERALPSPGEWSLATTRFPEGETAYAYGALFFDYLARTRGAESIPEFIARSSRATFPFRLNHVARESFGITFNALWREWRDSLWQVAADSAPLPGWRSLTRAGRVALYPRWQSDSALIYTAATGRETPGAYSVDTLGRIRRVGRRNSVDVNDPAPGGGVIFAQLEFADPYRLRSDLYVQRGSRQRRLTRGARLGQPDVRADGTIVAVRTVPGTNQLVRVSRDGTVIVPLTTAALDTQWAEPRWSSAGDRIAVTRWTRGGYADVVILDSTGSLLREVTHDRAVDSSPSFTPDGRAVLFTSDRSGVADIYVAATDPAVGDTLPMRVSDAAVGVFYPALAPDARALAAVRFRVDGWHVGVAPAPGVIPATSSGPDAGARWGQDGTLAPNGALADSTTPPGGASSAKGVVSAMGTTSAAGAAGAASAAGTTSAAGAMNTAPVARDSSPSRPYSPWPALLPHYWLPLIGERSDGGVTVGAFTSGSDVVGRHAYSAQLLLDPRGEEPAFAATYRYAGLGQPVFDAGAEQRWERGPVFDATGARVGTLRRRARTAVLAATVRRVRVRAGGYLTLGGELEQRDYFTEPGDLLPRLDPYYASGPLYRTVLASAGWSTAQRPPLSISPEDGISIAATGRLRWLASAAGVDQRSLTTTLAAYRSLPLGGFAHHVLATRVAVGMAAGRASGEYGVGGASGDPTALVPGVAVGDARTFPVRGFSGGAESGSRALSATLEYRAPLAELHAGRSLWPVFLDRMSLALFTDAGRAWNPGTGPPSLPWLASAGAELSLDAALQYDVPYRIRVGVAVPIAGRALSGSALGVYVRLGLAF